MMLKCGLVLSYDPTVAGIESASRVEISPSGQQHLSLAEQDWVYMESMIEVTPLLNREVFSEISSYIAIDLPHARRKAIRTFLEYLIDEDSKYCLVPDHAMYAGQRRLIEQLEHQSSRLSQPMLPSASARYGRLYGKVVMWETSKGYGFLSPGENSGRDIFVHCRDVVNIEGDVIPVGSVVEYDLQESRRGLQAVRAAVIS